jgi:hypothetical protein
MGNGFSRSPKLLKGALVGITQQLMIPIPNIIIFHYNPTSLSRNMEPYREESESDHASGPKQTPDTSQPFDPSETFSLALELDATDALEEPETHPVAFLTGVADRIAAMEMLLYPRGDSLLGGLLGSASASLSVGSGGVSASLGAGADVVPRQEVQIVLFVWGPGRIVPVRLTSFAVEEQFFSPILYPIHAKVTIGLKVLTPENLPKEDSVSKDLAVACYQFTRGQKEVLALANVANTVESILGMLPF